MAAPDAVFCGTRVATPEGIRPATVFARAGRIHRVAAFGESEGSALPVIDAGARLLLPGFVDTHVHVNDPGRADWEGFPTATMAAAAAGITTVVDMPLNSDPVTTTVMALERKAAAAEGRCRVDYGFWGGAVPGNARELPALLRAGVLGIKCFMAPSGLEAFQNVSEADLRAAMEALASVGGVMLAHAEWPSVLSLARQTAGLDADRRSYRAYAASRPPEAEVRAIEVLLRLCEATRCRVHIVHVAAAQALPIIRRAKEVGLPVTAETCPHYLVFAAEDIPDGATVFKCAPPIRGRDNRERLWEGLRDGVLELIASDHSPCPPMLKHIESGDFAAAWGGIASLQLGPAAVWTEASRRGFGPEDLVRWMSAAPARLAGLTGRKGAIAPGYDADLVIIDDAATFRVDPAALHHRHRLTPYAGRELRGAAEATYLRGRKIYERGAFAGEPSGRWLRSAPRGEGSGTP